MRFRIHVLASREFGRRFAKRWIAFATSRSHGRSEVARAMPA
jgi:hypothetical protein